MDAIAVFIGIGLMVAIIRLSSAYASRMSTGNSGVSSTQTVSGQVKTAAKSKPSSISSADKQRALEVYKELVKEKLDVIKTAVAMGYEERELSALDERLEQLIGKEQLARIAEGQTVSIPAELQQSNLDVERQKLQEMRQQALH